MYLQLAISQAFTILLGFLVTAFLLAEEGRCMKAYKKKTWQYETIGVDGDTILFGVNIFDYKWRSADKSVKVRDPLYGQEYKFSVYTVIIGGQEYEFAAGEFSNCVWGFYILKY